MEPRLTLLILYAVIFVGFGAWGGYMIGWSAGYRQWGRRYCVPMQHDPRIGAILKIICGKCGGLFEWTPTPFYRLPPKKGPCCEHLDDVLP